MLHEYVDLFRLRLPINPREQTFAQMPPPSLAPSSGLRRRRQWVNILPVSRLLSLQTRLFIQSEGRTADGGGRGSIQMRLAVRTLEYVHHFRPLHLNAARLIYRPLALAPGRGRPWITSRGGSEGGRFQFTHVLAPPWQNNQSEPPYQPLLIADLSRNLCQKRRHLRGRLQTA